MEERSEIMGEDGFMPGMDLLPEERDQTAEMASSDATNVKSSDSPLVFEYTMEDAKVENCPISAIRFHRKYDEVVLTAHGERTDGKINSPRGSISVWSLRDGHGVLQRSLIARTAITALDLPRISPTLVLAGTKGGNLLIWDTRVKTSLPISCNARRGTSFHDFHDRQTVTGVYSTSFASQYFLTTSSDGYVCKWSLANLDCPVDRSTLQTASGIESLGIESIDIPPSTKLTGTNRSGVGRSTTIFIGGRCGGVFRAEENGSRWTMCPGHGQHQARVTSISAHPYGSRNPFLKDVVISSSEDWTVRVWSLQGDEEPVELRKFDTIAEGVIREAAWSPQHPTLFCTCSDAGKLSLFDVSGRISPPGRASWDYTPEGPSRQRMNTLRWSDDSRLVCTGSYGGQVSIWKCKSPMKMLPDSEWMGHFVRSRFGQKP